MATLLSWTSVGIGDLDIFVPSPPCLVVYTSYVDDEPESSVTYFWQDESTGAAQSRAGLPAAGLVRNRGCMGAGACADTQRRADPRQARAGEEGGRTKGESKACRQKGRGEEGAGEKDSGKEGGGEKDGSRQEIAGSQRAKEESLGSDPL